MQISNLPTYIKVPSNLYILLYNIFQILRSDCSFTVFLLVKISDDHLVFLYLLTKQSCKHLTWIVTNQGGREHWAVYFTSPQSSKV